jgi:putative chitinase
VNLSEHFTLDEMIFSSTAQRLNIDNSPPLEVVAHLTVAAISMEKVRALLANPIRVNSGYRCPDLNKVVGGSKTSAHMTGYAVDFVCPKFGAPIQIVKAIAESGIVFDQCIQEGSWVHISFDPRARRQLLTAHFGQGGTTYTAGIT